MSKGCEGINHLFLSHHRLELLPFPVCIVFQCCCRSSCEVQTLRFFCMASTDWCLLVVVRTPATWSQTSYSTDHFFCSLGVCIAIYMSCNFTPVILTYCRVWSKMDPPWLLAFPLFIPPLSIPSPLLPSMSYSE